MASRKKKDELWGVEQADTLMDAMFSEAKKMFGGDGFYTGTEAEQLIIGLPLPALCLRYLFQSTVFPLSRMTVVTGQQGSCKSAFLYEIFRWHRLAGGRNVLLECETKDSPDLRSSILNYDRQAVAVKSCGSLEEWQDALTSIIGLSQKTMTGTKSAPGPGRLIPFCVGIDSLMAKASQETIDKILKEGHADRSHPVEALKLSSFMRAWPQRLAGWPFSVVGTNHLKPTTDHMGRPGRNIPGGMAPKFQETYEIEMAYVGDIRRADHEGVAVSLLARKNSLGPSRRKINASLVWWNEIIEEESEDTTDERKYYHTVQRTMWNWHSASIELLLEIQSKDAPRWKKIQQVLDLRPERSKGNVVWSEALGISRDDAVPYRLAGEILETKPEILSYLHAMLGIRERIEFQTGMDYLDQLSVAKLVTPAEEAIRQSQRTPLGIDSEDVESSDTVASSLNLPEE